MGTIAFSDYIASRPSATTPLDSGDSVLIIQGGVVKRVASSETGNAIPTVLIDSSLNPVTLLPASGEIVYARINESDVACSFAVSVAGQTMCQELQAGLAVMGEGIRVKLIGTNWYRIG